jgi:hypothetical protein
MSREFGVGSCDSSVFVDHAVDDLVSTDGGVDRDDEGRVVVGRTLLASLVRSVVIEMPNVLVKDCGGVPLVVDQNTVSALCADAAHKSLGVAVRSWCRGGIFTVSMPSPANTASNDVANFVSRSRSRNRNWAVRSSRSAKRLRAACVVQTEVGWAVTPRIWTRRVWTSITNRT